METQKLINRINRIQGQLDAVKRGIEDESTACVDVIRLMKASHQGVKKLSHAYMEEYVSSCSKEHKLTLAQEKMMKEVLDAFTTL